MKVRNHVTLGNILADGEDPHPSLTRRKFFAIDKVFHTLPVNLFCFSRTLMQGLGLLQWARGGGRYSFAESEMPFPGLWGSFDRMLMVRKKRFSMSKFTICLQFIVTIQFYNIFSV
jgi:hypothetical protein